MSVQQTPTDVMPTRLATILKDLTTAHADLGIQETGNHAQVRHQ